LAKRFEVKLNHSNSNELSENCLYNTVIGHKELSAPMTVNEIKTEMLAMQATIFELCLMKTSNKMSLRDKII